MISVAFRRAALAAAAVTVIAMAGSASAATTSRNPYCTLPSPGAPPTIDFGPQPLVPHGVDIGCANSKAPQCLQPGMKAAADAYWDKFHEWEKRTKVPLEKLAAWKKAADDYADCWGRYVGMSAAVPVQAP